MARSLSNDLRWRVVRAYEAKEGTYRKLAKRFGIGTASVTRILALHHKNGTPAPRPHGGGNQPKVDAKGLELIARIVKDNPSATLLEFGQQYERVTSIKIDKSIVFCARKKLGITRKKRLHATERDSNRIGLMRWLFRAVQRQLKAHDRLFLDETGVSLSMINAYGCGLVASDCPPMRR